MRPLNFPKIDLRNKPMLLPAAAFAAGTLLAFQVSYLSISLLAALALAGLALGRRAGVCLAFFACGLLAAAVRLGLPGDPAASLRRGPPVGAGPPLGRPRGPGAAQGGPPAPGVP